jgi:hypothetical protein
MKIVNQTELQIQTFPGGYRFSRLDDGTFRYGRFVLGGCGSGTASPEQVADRLWQNYRRGEPIPFLEALGWTSVIELYNRRWKPEAEASRQRQIPKPGEGIAEPEPTVGERGNNDRRRELDAEVSNQAQITKLREEIAKLEPTVRENGHKDRSWWFDRIYERITTSPDFDPEELSIRRIGQEAASMAAIDMRDAERYRELLDKLEQLESGRLPDAVPAEQTTAIGIGQRVRHRRLGLGTLHRKTRTATKGLVEWDSHQIAVPLKGYTSNHSWVLLTSLSADNTPPRKKTAEKVGGSKTPARERPDPETLVEPLTEALAGMHGRFREGWIARHECDVADNTDSRCPFCRWNIQTQWGDGTGCAHLITVLMCDWGGDVGPEGGTTGGSLENIAGQSFGPLNDAITRLLMAAWRRSLKNPNESLSPMRLRALVEGIAKDAEIEDGLTGTGEDDNFYLRRSVRAESDAYGDYILGICRAAGIPVTRTHYDTGDPFGTSPYAFWAADPAGAANELARAIDADLETLAAALARVSGT